jgi:hypothetical protein
MLYTLYNTLFKTLFRTILFVKYFFGLACIFLFFWLRETNLLMVIITPKSRSGMLENRDIKDPA